MERTSRVIRHPDDLASLSVMPLMRPRPGGVIRIESDAIRTERRTDWERRLNRAYRACGCAEASLGSLAGLLVAGVLIGVRIADGAGFDFSGGAILLGSIFVGGLLGKAVGLLRAQSKLDRTIRELRSEWKAPPRTVASDGCG